MVLCKPGLAHEWCKLTQRRPFKSHTLPARSKSRAAVSGLLKHERTPLLIARSKRGNVCSRSLGETVAVGALASSEDIDEKAVTLSVPSNVALPEELTPLVEALEQAQQRVDQVTALREALETKAQEVGQLAISSREEVSVAAKLAEEARDEATATEIVQHKLRLEVDELHRKLEASGPAAEAGRGGEILATLELKDAGATVPVRSKTELEEELVQKEALLESVGLKLTQLLSTVNMIEGQHKEAEKNASQAEEIASHAMKAAEEAVRDEMEAAAVTKGTKKALEKALADLKDLGISFAEVDERTAQERSKALEQSKLDAEKAVSAALESEDVTGALAGVEVQLRYPSGAPPDVPLAASAKTDAPRKVASPVIRTRATGSMDEDAAGARKQKQSAALVARGLQLAVAAAFIVLFVQLLPGGILGNTAAGQAVQAKVQAVSSLFQLGVAKVTGLLNKLPFPEVPHGEEGLIETLWLLLTSVIAVPLICKLPGGSPVLGFLAGGAVIGPYALGIIQDVEGVRHLAELGVVFLLFNIGLELSLERLRSMQKFVFGMGTAQVVTTLAAVAYVTMALTGIGGSAAVVLGGGLALSSTAVAMQVLQDRNETGSHHGRAAFAILLLQDLAVVVLLMLIPLLAPAESGSEAAGFSKIARALGIAAIKAVSCIVGIILAGRTMLRPLYRRIADLDNAAIFSATTLLVVLGTSVVTQFAGLSLALGAFLAGLLLAETEFVMQVESDIAPFKDLFMGLFFMTVGMEISFSLFLGKFRQVMGALALLLVGKVALMVGVGQIFGLSRVQSARAGLLLAAGGEFAFVAFGEAVHHKILPAELVRFLFVVVALSMALTPFLADFGSKLSKTFERGDMKLLQPNEKETGELRDHVIIAGFGRVGQIIAQLLSERLIPFVALDVRADRVQVGKDADLPVYFGDAGSSAILHSVGAAHARVAVITLDTPGANYRSVWALHKHYPNVKIYVRAHDVTHGVTLEKAGATAVVPETLEPSLQLASAVLSQLNMPADEVAQAIQTFRKTHVAELQVLCRTSGSTLGYGFPTVDDDDEEFEGIPLQGLTEAVA